jgi:hypothetical protein
VRERERERERPKHLARSLGGSSRRKRKPEIGKRDTHQQVHAVNLEATLYLSLRSLVRLPHRSRSLLLTLASFSLLLGLLAHRIGYDDDPMGAISRGLRNREYPH